MGSINQNFHFFTERKKLFEDENKFRNQKKAMILKKTFFDLSVVVGVAK